MEKLKQARWANFDEITSRIISFEGKQPIQMKHSDGTALPLLVDDSKTNKFGADIIRFAPGEGVGLHKHIGAHILMVTKGSGILVYEDERHSMFEGMIYLVPSNIAHAIEATTEIVLVAIGNDYRPANSEERLNIVG